MVDPASGTSLTASSRRLLGDVRHIKWILEGKSGVDSIAGSKCGGLWTAAERESPSAEKENSVPSVLTLKFASSNITPGQEHPSLFDQHQIQQ